MSTIRDDFDRLHFALVHLGNVIYFGLDLDLLLDRLERML